MKLFLSRAALIFILFSAAPWFLITKSSSISHRLIFTERAQGWILTKTHDRSRSRTRASLFPVIFYESHIRNKRTAVEEEKNARGWKIGSCLLYIQSARYLQIVEMKEGSDSWERESSGLGSRERCYQRDEGTKRGLRIIESYDCLFRASAIRGCSSCWTRLG